MPKIAVVYYSLSGNTRAAAQRVAEAAGAELFEIRDARPRQGAFGVLRAIWEVLAGRSPRISAPPVSPDACDALVLACPVWAGRPASPLHAWIAEAGEIECPVGLLTTLSSEDAGGALSRLESALGRCALAKAAISEADRRQGLDAAKLDSFALAIKQVADQPDGGAPPLRLAAWRSA